VSNALLSSGFGETQIDAATALFGEYWEITRPWDDSAEIFCNANKPIYQAKHHGENGFHAVLCYGEGTILSATQLYVFFSVNDSGSELYGVFEGACADVTWDQIDQGACESICDDQECFNEAKAVQVRPCGVEPTPGPTVAPTETDETPAPTVEACASKATFDASCLIAQDKKSCEANGCKWKKNECKTYGYDNSGKTKKIKCKKVSEDNCVCYQSINNGCKPSYKKDKFKKCGGKMQFKEALHGPEL